MKNQKQLPMLNWILAVFVMGSSLIFSMISAAVGVLAMFEIPFIYGSFVIKYFPYGNSIFDLAKAMLRLCAGISPVLIILPIGYVIIAYLTEGGQAAKESIGSVCKGFIYQIRHPFSNPRNRDNLNDR